MSWTHMYSLVKDEFSQCPQLEFLHCNWCLEHTYIHWWRMNFPSVHSLSFYTVNDVLNTHVFIDEGWIFQCPQLDFLHCNWCLEHTCIHWWRMNFPSVHSLTFYTVIDVLNTHVFIGERWIFPVSTAWVSTL